MPISAEPKKAAIPAELTSAKTMALINETGTQAVLDTATKEFEAWGRYKIVPSQSDADITIKFTHKNGMDMIGNMGFIEMDVYSKGNAAPLYTVKKSFRNIFQPQQRTKNCIFDLEDRVEGRS